MHDYQIELIAALVEGRLEDESEARALIDSAPEFRDEYEAQKIAYEMLSRAGTASLADVERSALRRDVWTTLRQGIGSSPGRGAWRYRWVAVAAGMFVVVGLAAVLGQVGGGDSGETFAEMAADQDEGATTTAAATDGDLAGAGRAEESADDSADTMSEASETTVAEAGSTAPADEDVAAYYAGEAERVRSGEFGDRLQAPDESDSEVAACVADAGLDGHRPVATLVAPPGIAGEDDTRLAIAVPDDSELAGATVAFVDMATCEVVHTDE